MSDDDTNDDAEGENLYLKAIHHPDREEQLLAMHQFISQEIRDQFERLKELAADDGSAPGENIEQWSYEKGKLDQLRTQQGLVTQACLAQDVFKSDDE